MKTFEDKLHQAAQQLATNENKQLRLPKKPDVAKRPYWGWIATPVAIVAGLILGMFLPPMIEEGKENLQTAHVRDTIMVNVAQHDTLYLTQVVEKEKIVEKVKYVVSKEERQTDDLKQVSRPTEKPVCTSVACDGINYSLLVSN